MYHLHYDYAVKPSLDFRYAFLYWLTSVSPPLLRGVHLGSSLNRRIAFVYYQKVSASRYNKLAISRTHIFLIRRETMVNTSRHNHQITLLQGNTNPIVILASDIKVSASVDDVPDFLVLV
jgi:hypothetical protein